MLQARPWPQHLWGSAALRHLGCQPRHHHGATLSGPSSVVAGWGLPGPLERHAQPQKESPPYTGQWEVLWVLPEWLGPSPTRRGVGPVVLSQVLWVQASEGEMRDISNQRGLRGPSREPDGQLATSPRPGGRDIGPVSMVTWLVTDLRTSGTLSPAQTQDSWAGQTRSSTSTLSPNTQCIP